VSKRAAVALDAAQIVRVLHDQYRPPAWVSVAEVRGSTGYDNTQRLDFWTMHTWPSKGFRSLAMEIKVSRADFARELADPCKRAFAESVAGECYFVTPAGLLDKDEIPAGWGLKVVNSNGAVVTLKSATQRPTPPLPLGFIASLLRSSEGEASPLPRLTWVYAGQPLTEAQLDALLSARYEGQVERARHLAAYEAVAQFKKGEQYTRLLDLEAEANRITRLYRATAPELRAAVAAIGGTGARPGSAARLRLLRDELTKYVDEMAAAEDAAQAEAPAP
jgi:hypothetical protein